MKIPTDLRVIIRSAVKAHNQSLNRVNEGKALQEAITTFLATSKHKAKIRRAAAQIAAFDLKAEDLRTYLRGFGLNAGLDYIRDNEKFTKAGGKLPTKNTEKNLDTVLANLAAATPTQGKAILKSLNITWE